MDISQGKARICLLTWETYCDVIFTRAYIIYLFICLSVGWTFCCLIFLGSLSLFYNTTPTAGTGLPAEDAEGETARRLYAGPQLLPENTDGGGAERKGWFGGSKVNWTRVCRLISRSQVSAWACAQLNIRRKWIFLLYWMSKKSCPIFIVYSLCKMDKTSWAYFLFLLNYILWVFLPSPLVTPLLSALRYWILSFLGPLIRIHILIFIDNGH